MRGIWLFFKFLIILAVAIVGASFAINNGQLVAVDFVVLSGPSLSLGLWLLLFLAAGVCLGILASSALIWSYRRKISLRDKKDQLNHDSL